MESFSSTADMLHQYELSGWEREKTTRGFTLKPPSSIGDGLIIVWGKPESHCYINSSVTFHSPLIERYFYKHKTIQISFVDDMTLTYYQNKSEVSDADFGLYCFINNIPRPWFKRFPANAHQKVFSILITEKFLSDSNLSLPHNGWDRLARAFNSRKIFIPALAMTCLEIKNTTIIDEAFEFYFHGKVTEIIGMLLDYTIKAEQSDFPIIHEKSRKAAKDALQILNKSYVQPPVIEDLAQAVGIDKKTLQNAFKQFTGQSVHEYTQSLKMEQALKLFEDKSLRIDQIANMVGYQSKISFYKAFEKTFGCKPNEARTLICK